MTAADWVRLALERAASGSGKLQGWSADRKYAVDELAEAFDQLHTAAQHVADALAILQRKDD